MNTNPNAIKVLCYGDSNTWGQNPDKTGRQPSNIRWTGVLQDLLGNDYYVVEEGLSSRTTDLEYTKRPGRNGKEYLIPCLASHNPIDIVVLMLGSNDFKLVFDRSTELISNAVEGLVEIINEYGNTKTQSSPKVILVSPIHVNTKAPRFLEFYDGIYDESSEKKSQELASHLQNVAEKWNCKFLDASTVAKPGEDGLHLATEWHRPLASAIRQLI